MSEFQQSMPLFWEVMDAVTILANILCYLAIWMYCTEIAFAASMTAIFYYYPLSWTMTFMLNMKHFFLYSCSSTVTAHVLNVLHHHKGDSFIYVKYSFLKPKKSPFKTLKITVQTWLSTPVIGPKNPHDSATERPVLTPKQIIEANEEHSAEVTFSRDQVERQQEDRHLQSSLNELIGTEQELLVANSCFTQLNRYHSHYHCRKNPHMRKGIVLFVLALWAFGLSIVWLLFSYIPVVVLDAMGTPYCTTLLDEEGDETSALRCYRIFLALLIWNHWRLIEWTWPPLISTVEEETNCRCVTTVEEVQELQMQEEQEELLELESSVEHTRKKYEEATKLHVAARQQDGDEEDALSTTATTFEEEDEESATTTNNHVVD